MSVFKSERLILREFVIEDAASLVKIFGDPNVMKFSSNGPLNKEKIESFIEWCINSYQSNGYGQWGVIERSTGEIIGSCGLSDVEVDGMQEVEIGYRVEKSRWGKGFATEMAENAIDCGSKSFNIEEVVAIIANNHTASIHVANKIGFQQYKECSFKGWDVRVYKKHVQQNNGLLAVSSG